MGGKEGDGEGKGLGGERDKGVGKTQMNGHHKALQECLV